MVLRAVLRVGEIGLGVLLAMGSNARTRARIVKTRIERGLWSVTDPFASLVSPNGDHASPFRAQPRTRPIISRRLGCLDRP